MTGVRLSAVIYKNYFPKIKVTLQIHAEWIFWLDVVRSRGGKQWTYSAKNNSRLQYKKKWERSYWHEIYTWQPKNLDAIRWKRVSNRRYCFIYGWCGMQDSCFSIIRGPLPNYWSVKLWLSSKRRQSFPCLSNAPRRWSSYFFRLLEQKQLLQFW